MLQTQSMHEVDLPIYERYGLFDRNVPRYTRYPTALHFAEEISDGLTEQWLRQLPIDEPVSIYLHIPFCRRVCWFCACATQGVSKTQSIQQYLATLHLEIDHVIAASPGPLPLSRVHLGGGTPTLLSATDIHQLFDHLDQGFRRQDQSECSIEIDPNEIDSSRMHALVERGLNRVSLGVQDFDPHVQALIGRTQSFEITQEAVELARLHGIQSVNVDMLYGLPEQTEARLLASVDQLIDLHPDRIALYGYAHVPWMAKRQVMIPEAALPNTRARFHLAQKARHQLIQAGYVGIGIDHFAKPTDGLARAQQRHQLRRNFQGYTDDQAETLIGLGASAISRFKQGYRQNETKPSAYRDKVQAGQFPTRRGHRFAGEDRTRAALIEQLLCEFAIDHRTTAPDLDLPVVTASIGQILREFPDLVDATPYGLAIHPEARPLTRMIAASLDRYAIASTAHSTAI